MTGCLRYSVNQKRLTIIAAVATDALRALGGLHCATINGDDAPVQIDGTVSPDPI